MADVFSGIKRTVRDLSGDWLGPILDTGRAPAECGCTCVHCAADDHPTSCRCTGTN